jgi:hypothetical protein
VNASPERMVWVSDWPHPTEKTDTKPDDTILFDPLAVWAPDEARGSLFLPDVTIPEFLVRAWDEAQRQDLKRRSDGYVKNGVTFTPQVLASMSRAFQAATEILGIRPTEDGLRSRL